jgi:hypothetical protein
MKRLKEDFARPYALRDFEFVRAGPEGAHWRSADGMVVRLAAAEGERSRLRKAPWRDTPQTEWEVALGRSGAT